MKCFFNAEHKLHDPKGFLVAGVQRQSPEQPERATRLLEAAKAANCAAHEPSDHGLAPIARIHSPRYLNFLQTIHDRWSRVPGAGPEVIPNVHPSTRCDSYPASPVGQAGFHQADTACPIGAGTWKAAYWSAQTAISAASDIQNGAQSAYALCRPPGHHAFGEIAGGFCFLNNAAIAADHFAQNGFRPAILDIDVHHGNGTQGIFYERSDVLTVSVHTDPAGFYPFYWGHAHEMGAGLGAGYNINRPLPRGAGDAEFLRAVDHSLEDIHRFGADVLILALGLDAHESDPFEGMRVTTDGFGQIAQRIANIDLPTLIVQEGGYLSPHLGTNLTRFLTAFQEGHQT